jgi:hypothetical protein
MLAIALLDDYKTTHTSHQSLRRIVAELLGTAGNRKLRSMRSKSEIAFNIVE